VFSSRIRPSAACERRAPRRETGTARAGACSSGNEGRRDGPKATFHYGVITSKSRAMTIGPP
jgi:hypothetical protein